MRYRTFIFILKQIMYYSRAVAWELSNPVHPVYWEKNDDEKRDDIIVESIAVPNFIIFSIITLRDVRSLENVIVRRAKLRGRFYYKYNATSRGVAFNWTWIWSRDEVRQVTPKQSASAPLSLSR